MVQEVDCVDALRGVGGLVVEEGLQRGKVQLARELHEDFVLVLARIPGTARREALISTIFCLLCIQVHFNSEFIPREPLAAPTSIRKSKKKKKKKKGRAHQASLLPS
ncbi:hypothetical protein PMIN04_004880 [Paraphaeosphaeria minitans]